MNKYIGLGLAVIGTFIPSVFIAFFLPKAVQFTNLYVSLLVMVLVVSLIAKKQIPLSDKPQEVKPTENIGVVSEVEPEPEKVSESTDNKEEEFDFMKQLHPELIGDVQEVKGGETNGHDNKELRNSLWKQSNT